MLVNKTKGDRGIFDAPRALSVAAFSFLFAYLLSFLFEGQVLYGLIGMFGVRAYRYILTAILAHLTGLFTCGWLTKSQQMAKRVLIGGMLVCMAGTMPFFFAPSFLWLVGLFTAGFAGGCAVAAWGYFLKAFTPKKERIKSCADVLIISNIMMIVINVVTMNGSPSIGLVLAMFCLAAGAALSWRLPVDFVNVQPEDNGQQRSGDLNRSMRVLFLFVAVITVNSGLMYQVINPAFGHLTGLVSWYWAVPYVIALLLMRNLPLKAKRPLFLYLGMAMIMAAFILFMLLNRSAADYLVVNTLMLGACGIFDLFWWSIIGEMLDHTNNPAKVFGIGLSANVFGVLCGGMLGAVLTSIQIPEAEVTVIALSVICVTLIILPPLNRQLAMLLNSHVYLTAYERMNEKQQENIIHQSKMLDPLTEREQEVLQLLLSGRSNKDIAGALFITENTVKTHVRNIYSKYGVGSRVELISTLLKNQANV